MRVEVKVPQLPESVAEATLVSWHKKAGEAVKRDENLIDIETDKVVLELPAPARRRARRGLKGDGATVTSNEVIAVHRHRGQGALRRAAARAEGRREAEAATRRAAAAASRRAADAPGAKRRPARCPRRAR